MFNQLFRKAFLISVLSLSATNSFSQRITFSDLKYVLYNDLENVETHLMKKGLNYAGIDDNKGTSSYNYTKNSKYSKDYLAVSKFIYDDISFYVHTFSLYKSDYISMKSQIKQLGFILTSTERHDQSIIYYYKKGGLEITFWVTPKDGFSTYSISLYDLARQKKAFDKMKENNDFIE